MQSPRLQSPRLQSPRAQQPTSRPPPVPTTPREVFNSLARIDTTSSRGSASPRFTAMAKLHGCSVDEVLENLIAISVRVPDEERTARRRQQIKSAVLTSRPSSKAPAAAGVSIDYQSQLTDQLATKFSNIRDAFKHVDLNNDGVCTREEIRRALKLFNMEPSEAKLDALMKQCDQDGDGKVGYDEFVDALARDTVTVAAMGKRGLTAKEAMGVDDYEEFVAKQIRGEKVKHAYSMESKPAFGY